MIDLDSLPSDWPRRRDSALEQLRDLVFVANKLGLTGGADAIRQLFDTGKAPILQFTCTVDDDYTDRPGEPDDCVINMGCKSDCIYARLIDRPEQCDYWKVYVKKGK